ncbi:DENN domain-containing protein 5B [Eurytemora carolleeae]|uniref:DENN domain-containing protein 5B n=1 Tax=Eurytemora carolleeae TaxID=1294199 RepID=UPI000C7880E8|nr:DENN domain-containing protein 5B [Eurytemora carolleeae]|eukprot:XP_023328057.1 DENN domain-containing protein 5B-like [Eurytemora affinis]
MEMREIVKDCAGPLSTPSPALSLRTTGSSPDDVEIQTTLGEAINRLIKHHHKSLKEKVSWAQLMCGELGLVHALIQVFSFGFKSARLFGRNLTVWDFFLKVTFDFNQSQGSSALNSSPQASPRKSSDRQTSTVPRTTQLRRMYTRLITRIETTCTRLGKDDKFQLFVCLAVHDRLLQRIVADLTKAVAAIQLYDEFSFLRDPTLAGFIIHVLEALTPVEVPVDPAMKKTLELQ